MKKALATTAITIAFSSIAFSQFQPNNIVVSQTENTDTKGTALKLIEYSTEGTLVSSANLGLNNFYVGGANSSASEGVLSLSTDGKLLSLFGYSSISPSAVGPSNNTAAENNRALAIIDQNKNQTIIPFANIHEKQAAKAALAFPISENNYGIYLAGSGTGAVTGVQYTTVNTQTKSSSAPISLAKVNTRSIKSYNDQLYISSSFNPPSGATRLLKVGSGLPVTGQTATNLPGSAILSLEAPTDFVMFGNDLIYIAEENATTGGIKKLYYNGTEWVLLGIIDSGIASDFGFRALTGRLENGKRVLYAVTSANVNNSILKITDETAKTAAVERCVVGLEVKPIARASTSNGFRGIAFSPESNVSLPVGLHTFSTKKETNGISIHWVTSFEEQSSHYILYRSTDGITFTAITKADAKGTASAYKFIDKDVSTGTYYYQLKQVDINGEHKLFGPVTAHIDLAINEFDIHYKDNSLSIPTSAELQNVKIELLDIAGKTVFSKNTLLEKGNNNIAITAGKLAGVYIVRITSPTTNISKKFIAY